jgi:hypothetical protein
MGPTQRVLGGLGFLVGLAMLLTKLLGHAPVRPVSLIVGLGLVMGGLGVMTGFGVRKP